MDNNIYGNTQYGNYVTNNSSSQLASKMMMMDEDGGGGGGGGGGGSGPNLSSGGSKRDANSMLGQPTSNSAANSQMPSNEKK